MCRVIGNLEHCFPFWLNQADWQGAIYSPTSFRSLQYPSPAGLLAPLVLISAALPGISDAVSTIWTSHPIVLRFTGTTPGMNDSIAWGQEKEASVLHDVAVQTNKL